MRRWHVLLLALAAAAVAALLLWPEAQIPAPPAAATAPPPVTPALSAPSRWEEVRFGRKVRFVERRYDPPLPCPFVARSATSLASPEDAARAVIAATAAGDATWWREVWDAEAQKHNRRSAYRAGRTPEAEARERAKRLEGATVVVTHRQDVLDPIGGYVILITAIRFGDGTTGNAPVAVRQVGASWLATQDLADSPLIDTVPAAERRAYATVSRLD